MRSTRYPQIRTRRPRPGRGIEELRRRVDVGSSTAGHQDLSAIRRWIRRGARRSVEQRSRVSTPSRSKRGRANPTRGRRGARRPLLLFGIEELHAVGRDPLRRFTSNDQHPPAVPRRRCAAAGGTVEQGGGVASSADRQALRCRLPRSYRGRLRNRNERHRRQGRSNDRDPRRRATRRPHSDGNNPCIVTRTLASERHGRRTHDRARLP